MDIYGWMSHVGAEDCDRGRSREDLSTAAGLGPDARPGHGGGFHRGGGARLTGSLPLYGYEGRGTRGPRPREHEWHVRERPEDRGGAAGARRQGSDRPPGGGCIARQRIEA